MLVLARLEMLSRLVVEPIVKREEPVLGCERRR